MAQYTAQSLALSSSTKNSEKLNQAGFNFPPRSYRSSSFIVKWYHPSTPLSVLARPLIFKVTVIRRFLYLPIPSNCRRTPCCTKPWSRISHTSI